LASDRSGDCGALPRARLNAASDLRLAVGQLVALGQVAPAPHASDRRKTVLSITAAGRARLEDERTRRVDWLATAIEDELTRDELRALERGIELLGRLARVR
jgi:DNA-binding MarR family transcriptional regulator